MRPSTIDDHQFLGMHDVLPDGEVLALGRTEIEVGIPEERRSWSSFSSPVEGRPQRSGSAPKRSACSASRPSSAYGREMTALAEATLAAGGSWRWVRSSSVTAFRATRAGRFVPAVIVGLGTGGPGAHTGSDLDLFVVFGGEGDRRRRSVDAHTFYSQAVERLASALGDITAAGVAFPVDLRLRPGSKGSGFAQPRGARALLRGVRRSLGAPEPDARAPGSRSTRAGPRRAARVRPLVYGRRCRAPALDEIRAVRTPHGARAGQGDAGPLLVKFGRGGLIDVEFLAQALQLVHGQRHPGRSPAGHRRRRCAALAGVGAFPASRPRAWSSTTASCAASRPPCACSGRGPPMPSSWPAPCRAAWRARSAHPSRESSWPTIAGRTAEVRGIREVARR